MAEVAECAARPNPAEVYQPQVALAGLSPLIWRLPLVTATATVAELHTVLQVVFGWGGPVATSTHRLALDPGSDQRLAALASSCYGVLHTVQQRGRPPAKLPVGVGCVMALDFSVVRDRCWYSAVWLTRQDLPAGRWHRYPTHTEHYRC